MLKDVLDTVNSRLSAPLFSSVILSFAALNWREIFYLIVANTDASQRIMYFDTNTSFWSLLVFPIIIGFIVAAIQPWSKLVGAHISQKPQELIHRLRTDSEKRNLLYKEEVLEAQGKVIAVEEEQIIEQAKRDEELLTEVKDEELREETKQQLKELRESRKSTQTFGHSVSSSHSLSEEEEMQIEVIQNRIKRIKIDLESESLGRQIRQDYENDLIQEYDNIAKIKGATELTSDKIGLNDRKLDF